MRCICPHTRNTAGTLFRSGWDERCQVHGPNDPWLPNTSLGETFMVGESQRVMYAEDIGLLPHHQD